MLKIYIDQPLVLSVLFWITISGSRQSGTTRCVLQIQAVKSVQTTVVYSLLSGVMMEVRFSGVWYNSQFAVPCTMKWRTGYVVTHQTLRFGIKPIVSTQASNQATLFKFKVSMLGILPNIVMSAGIRSIGGCDKRVLIAFSTKCEQRTNGERDDCHTSNQCNQMIQMRKEETYDCG